MTQDWPVFTVDKTQQHLISCTVSNYVFFWFTDRQLSNRKLCEINSRSVFLTKDSPIQTLCSIKRLKTIQLINSQVLLKIQDSARVQKVNRDQVPLLRLAFAIATAVYSNGGPNIQT